MKFDFSRFDFFGNNSNSSSKKRAAKQRRGRQCRIEELEGREMLSVTPWSLANDYNPEQSDIVEVQQGPQTPLEAIADPVVNAVYDGTGTVTVTWTAYDGDDTTGGPLDHYTVEWKLSSGSSWSSDDVVLGTFPATTATIDVSSSGANWTAGEEYNIRVIAHNASTPMSDAYADVEGWEFDAVVDPTGFAVAEATITEGEDIVLTWNDDAFTDADNQSYELWVSNDDGTTWNQVDIGTSGDYTATEDSDVVTVTIDDYLEGNYKFALLASGDAQGTDPWASAVLDVEVEEAPVSLPELANFDSSKTDETAFEEEDGTVTLEWDSFDAGDVAGNYVVTCVDDKNASVDVSAFSVVAGDTTDWKVVITGLAPGKYIFTVTCYDNDVAVGDGDAVAESSTSEIEILAAAEMGAIEVTADDVLIGDDVVVSFAEVDGADAYTVAWTDGDAVDDDSTVDAFDVLATYVGTGTVADPDDGDTCGNWEWVDDDSVWVIVDSDATWTFDGTDTYTVSIESLGLGTYTITVTAFEATVAIAEGEAEVKVELPNILITPDAPVVTFGDDVVVSFGEFEDTETYTITWTDGEETPVVSGTSTVDAFDDSAAYVTVGTGTIADPEEGDKCGDWEFIDDAWTIVDDSGDEVVTWTFDDGTYTVAIADLPIGEYAITITANDGTDNIAYGETDVKVKAAAVPLVVTNVALVDPVGTPTVYWWDGFVTMTWDANANATEYQVRYGYKLDVAFDGKAAGEWHYSTPVTVPSGTQYAFPEDFYDIYEEGAFLAANGWVVGWTFEVKAIGDGEDYTDSDWTPSATKTMSANDSSILIWWVNGTTVTRQAWINDLVVGSWVEQNCITAEGDVSLWDGTTKLKLGEDYTTDIDADGYRFWTGLTPGKTYTIKIVSSSPGFTTVETVATFTTTNFGVATNFVAATGTSNGEVDLTWTVSPEASATQYNIYYKPTGVTVTNNGVWTKWTGAVGAGSATIDGLAHGTSYDFRICAANATDQGYFASATATADGTIQAPGKPDNLATRDSGSSYVLVEWTNSGGLATSYEGQYRVKNSGKAPEADGEGWSSWGVNMGDGFLSSYGTFIHLASDTEYEFRIRAINSEGTSDWSEVYSEFTDGTLAKPAVPTGIAKASATTTTVVLSWTAPVVGATSTNPGWGGAAADYEVQYRTKESAPEGAFTPFVGSVSPAGTTISGLTAGTEYEFQVRATNTAGESAWVSFDAATNAPVYSDTPTFVYGSPVTNVTYAPTVNFADDGAAAAATYKLAWFNGTDWAFVPSAEVTFAVGENTKAFSADLSLLAGIERVVIVKGDTVLTGLNDLSGVPVKDAAKSDLGGTGIVVAAGAKTPTTLTFELSDLDKLTVDLGAFGGEKPMLALLDTTLQETLGAEAGVTNIIFDYYIVITDGNGVMVYEGVRPVDFPGNTVDLDFNLEEDIDPVNFTAPLVVTGLTPETNYTITIGVSLSIVGGTLEADYNVRETTPVTAKTEALTPLAQPTDMTFVGIDARHRLLDNPGSEEEPGDDPEDPGTSTWDVGWDVTLSWGEVTGAAGYVVQWRTNGDASDPSPTSGWSEWKNFDVALTDVTTEDGTVTYTLEKISVFGWAPGAAWCGFVVGTGVDGYHNEFRVIAVGDGIDTANSTPSAATGQINNHDTDFKVDFEVTETTSTGFTFEWKNSAWVDANAIVNVDFYKNGVKLNNGDIAAAEDPGDWNNLNFLGADPPYSEYVFRGGIDPTAKYEVKISAGAPGYVPVGYTKTLQEGEVVTPTEWSDTFLPKTLSTSAMGPNTIVMIANWPSFATAYNDPTLTWVVQARVWNSDWAGTYDPDAGWSTTTVAWDTADGDWIKGTVTGLTAATEYEFRIVGKDSEDAGGMYPGGVEVRAARAKTWAADTTWSNDYMPTNLTFVATGATTATMTVLWPDYATDYTDAGLYWRIQVREFVTGMDPHADSSGDYGWVNLDGGYSDTNVLGVDKIDLSFNSETGVVTGLITGLKPGTTYQIKIFARDAANTGSGELPNRTEYNQIFATTEAADATNSVTLTWDTTAEYFANLVPPAGQTVDHYEIHYRVSRTGSWGASTTVESGFAGSGGALTGAWGGTVGTITDEGDGVFSVQITGLKPGTAYIFGIKAVFSDTTEGITNAASDGTLRRTTAIGKPTLVAPATVTATSVTFTVDVEVNAAVINPGVYDPVGATLPPTVLGGTVQMFVEGAWVNVDPAKVTITDVSVSSENPAECQGKVQVTISGLAADTAHEFRVSIVNTFEEAGFYGDPAPLQASPWSDTIPAVTTALQSPGTAVLTLVDTTSTTVTVTFLQNLTGGQGPRSFIVYEGDNPTPKLDQWMAGWSYTGEPLVDDEGEPMQAPIGHDYWNPDNWTLTETRHDSGIHGVGDPDWCFWCEVDDQTDAPMWHMRYTGLTPGVTYTFVYEYAHPDEGYTPIVNRITVTMPLTDNQLATPSVTVGTVTQTSVALSWGADANATDFEVVVKQGGVAVEGATIDDRTDTGCVVNGLTAGTTYTFEVRAIAADPADNSYWGTATQATESEPVSNQLANPTGVNVGKLSGYSGEGEPGHLWGGTVPFSWNAVENATAGYQVRYSYVTDTGATFTSTAVAESGTSYTFTGLSSWHTDGSFIVSWTFEVMAVGAGEYTDSGWAAASNKLQINGNYGLGDALIDVRAVTSDSITYMLEFNTTANSWGGGPSCDCSIVVLGEGGNEVYRAAVAGGSGKAWASEFRQWKTITGLEAGKTYTIVVTSALPGFEAMVWTATATTKTLGTVSGVTAGAGPIDGSIDLSWTEAGMDNATGVYIYSMPKAWHTDGSRTEFYWSAPIFVAKGTGKATLENLAPGMEYEFRVCPTDGVNQFDPVGAEGNPHGGSAVITATAKGAAAPAKPDAPRLGGVRELTGATEIVLAWTPVEGGVTYGIQWRTAGTEGEWPETDSGNWTNGDGYPGVVRLAGFTVGESYEFRVQARNGEAVSAWSEVSTIVVAAATTPAVPGTPTVVSNTNTSVTLTWTDSANAVYNVQYRATGGEWVMADNNGPTGTFGTNKATITGLTPETEYEFRVAAVSFDKYSAWSGVSAAVTTNALASLGNFSRTVSDITNESFKVTMTIDFDIMPDPGTERAFYLTRGDDPTPLKDQFLSGWIPDPDNEGEWISRTEEDAAENGVPWPAVTPGFWLDVAVVGGGGWNGATNAEVVLTFYGLDAGVNYTLFYEFDKAGYTPTGVIGETVRTTGADMEGNVVVTANVVDGAVNVSWTEPTTPASGIAYSVAVKKDGAVVEGYTITGTGTSRTITGLAPGAYTIEVTADAEGYNPKTGTSGSVTIEEAVIEDQPMTGTFNFTVSAVAGGDVEVTYGGLTAGSGTVNYSVVVKHGETTLVKDTDYTVTEAGGVHTFSGLTVGESYTFTVTATAEGYITQTRTADVTPSAAGDIDMEGTLAVSATASGTTITVVSSGVSGPESIAYTIVIKKDGVEVPASDYTHGGGTSATQTFAGLAPGTYTFEVTASAAGYHAKTGSGTATVAETPVKPTLHTPENFAVDGAPTNTTVGFKWDAVSEATGYEIRFSSDGGKSWTVVDAGTGTSYIVANLAAGTPYTFQVRALKKEAGKTTVVSDWTTGTAAVSESTEGAKATVSTDKKSKPAGVKAGNAKNGAAKSTIDTVEFLLPGAGTTTNYVVSIEPSKIKFPKNFTWNGVSYGKGQEAAFLEALNAEIRIENGKAVVSGLPAGMKFTFNVQTVSADGSTLSAMTQVAATTAKYAATKIAAVKTETKLTSVVLNPTAPKVAMDTKFDDITYRILISFVTGSGKAKVTNYCVIEVDKDGSGFNVLSAAEAGTGLANGIKGNTAYFTDEMIQDQAGGLNAEVKEVTVNVKKGLKNNCIEITGLFASTKYAFAMQTVAEDVNGVKWASAVGKTSITTLKFVAPSGVKSLGVNATDKEVSLSWKVNMKLDVYKGYVANTNETVVYQVHLSDAKGNLTTGEWITLTDVTAPDGKGVVTGKLDATTFNLAAKATNTFVIRAVTTTANADGGAGVSSLVGKAKFKA